MVGWNVNDIWKGCGRKRLHPIFNIPATGWTIGVLGFDSRRGLGIFLFTTASRTAPGPTQHPIQWVPGVLFLGVKRPGREVDHSPPYSAEVKNAWKYTSIPQYVFMAWCLVKHRDTSARTSRTLRKPESAIETSQMRSSSADLWIVRWGSTLDSECGNPRTTPRGKGGARQNRTWYSLTHSLHGAGYYLKSWLSLSLSKNILLSYGNQRFIIVFTQAHHWTLSWASWIQFAPSIPISLRSILMSSYA
jgi:hypothetical protein